MKIADYLVVGSGCSAAMAAQTLLEAGAEVTIVDVGVANPDYKKMVPLKNFVDIRKKETDQHRYFIGDKAQGVNWEDIGKGAQITPPRQHMVQSVDKYIPLDSPDFSPLESLGYGGLGIGWGLQCWEFSDEEIKVAGLDAARMPDAYETVSKRIGISATKDDAAAYTMVHLKTYQPSPKMDRNHARIYKKYQQNREYYHSKGFYLGRTPLALLTKDLGKRKKYSYHGMDYYTDHEQSAWRPWMTIDQLKKKRNCTYVGNHLVVKFVEKRDHVEVHCLKLPNNEPVVLQCRTLVLGSGALGSARIVLRSQGKANSRLPLLCNPYTFIPCLQPAMMGKGTEQKKLGLAQLSLFLDESHSNYDVSVASMYSYQSLLLFRLIRQVPFLNLADARTLLQYFAPGLVIMGVHHPDHASASKFVRLANAKTPTGDKLNVSFQLSDDQKAIINERERKFVKIAHKLGVYPVKRVDPGMGASIHYAGTVPFSEQDKPLTLSQSGRLHGTKRVYIADSSGFNYLPARGLTFSLMANAHITAQKALNHE